MMKVFEVFQSIKYFEIFEIKLSLQEYSEENYIFPELLK